MGKKPQSSHSRSRRSKTASAVLDKLEKRFARFRAEHPRGTRVPVELREATLAALRADIAPGDLYRTCKISWGQLEAWKSGHKTDRRRGGTREASEEVRVFSVVDTEPVDRRAPVVAEEQDLELRLGRWSVHVRLVEPSEV